MSSRSKRHSRPIELLSPASLQADKRNARHHPRKQIGKLKRSINEFGFTNPILIDETGRVLAGHGRLEAALEMKLETVPCIRLVGLTEHQKLAVALVDNKVADGSAFDRERLASVLRELDFADYDVELTGFDTGEVDALILPPFDAGDDDPGEIVPEPPAEGSHTTRAGDLWRLGNNSLCCGDSRLSETYEKLLGGQLAQFVLADFPYNLRINGFVSNSERFEEFAEASGEMTPAEFTSFLANVMDQLVRHSADGSIHALLMDWRHVGEIIDAGRKAYAKLLNLCVWDKQTPGQGSMYRSQHELVFLFKNGLAPHINNINLSAYGRTRSNIWSYPGLSGFGAGRAEALAAHPTVKSLPLVADAIRDCTKRGGLVLDPFVGSGTTIIAAERTGRRAAAIEIDPRYCDVSIRRWQVFTGKTATLAASGRTFDEIAAERSAQPEARS